MILVAFKLILTPLLIGAATLGARRWGPVIGGWMISLPLTSGPVALFLALDRGPSFAASAADASVAGNLAIVAFCLGYAWVAVRADWRAAIGAAGIGWLAAALALQPALGLPVGVVFVLVTVVLGMALRVMPVGTARPSNAPVPRWDLPLRVLVGTTVVLALTAAAPALGSSTSGLLAMLPVIASVLAVFTQRRDGAGTAIGVLRGILTGLFGTAAFLTVVSASIQRLGVAVAFSAAIVTVVVIQLATLSLLRAVPARIGRQPVPGDA
ncbi:MAG: hypothetical protein ACP5VP_01105 [Candidatus Limnocylindrales bacterium]